MSQAMMGVFISLDFFLFYVFWEAMLVPMYFLIGIWGGPRKLYAATDDGQQRGGRNQRVEITAIGGAAVVGRYLHQVTQIGNRAPVAHRTEYEEHDCEPRQRRYASVRRRRSRDSRRPDRGCNG